jgi:hypothetical protein
MKSAAGFDGPNGKVWAGKQNEKGPGKIFPRPLAFFNVLAV